MRTEESERKEREIEMEELYLSPFKETQILCTANMSVFVYKRNRERERKKKTKRKGGKGSANSVTLSSTAGNTNLYCKYLP